MSAESTNVSSEASAKRSEQRILLHLPDLAAAPRPEPLPATLTRSSQARTRGMEVLQRVLSRRSGLLSGLFSRLTGPNRWQNRLWLATFSLIGISCLTLAMGMRQPAKEKQSAVAADPTLVEEYENDLGPADGRGADGKGAVRHVAAYHATHETQTGTPETGVIQPAAYETPQAVAPRGAWLEGTIIPDESE